MIRFTTSTGSTYLWDRDKRLLNRIERGPRSNPVMADQEWQKVLGDVFLTVGYCAVIALDRKTNQFYVTSTVESVEEIA